MKNLFDSFREKVKKYPVVWYAWYLATGRTPEKREYIVEDEQKVAYLMKSKAACSSIMVSMLRKKDVADDYSIHYFDDHSRMREDLFSDEDWFKFTFVRNPFSRLVSCYERKYHADRKFLGKTKEILDFDEYLGGYMKEDKGFAHFVGQVVKIPDHFADRHFRSQYRLLAGKAKKPAFDFIGKMERLEEEYRPIQEKYGFDPIRIYNRVEYGDWRDYYTEDLARKVFRKYKKDVEFFGYEQEYRDLLSHCMSSVTVSSSVH
ncbi:MAG: sulfotransferase family protein [Lachnospiraceae bacterium]|nr:sulfotransferase family protein [Lachnospiraceae bacterium]